MTFSESSRDDIIPNNIFGKKFNMTIFLPFSRGLVALIRHRLFTRWECMKKNFVCQADFDHGFDHGFDYKI
jgi:hypothetical protein